MKSRPRPVAVDLFAGAGGLSLGFESAGFDVLCSVEYDPVHAAVHEFNFPLTKVLCRSVASVDSNDVLDNAREGWRSHNGEEPWNDEIDVVFGGPPCQGFSLIGKRLVDDPRNELVFHFHRLVTELRPKFFVMENVPGMSRGGHAGILEQLIREFEEAGYNVRSPYRILNAAEFGVPQERKRLFLVGARSDQELPEYPLPTVAPIPKRSGRPIRTVDNDQLPKGPSVWDAIGDLPDLDLFDELNSGDAVELSDAQLKSQSACESTYAATLRGTQSDLADFSHGREWNRELLTSSARTHHTQKSIERFETTPVGETEPISRFYRLDPDGLCNTLRAGSGSERGAFTSPRPLHPHLPRVISVREAARLHSFPDWFRLHETKWHGFRQIGNAVAPLVGRAVGREIMRALGAQPSRPGGALTLGDTKLLSLTMKEAIEHFGIDPNEAPSQRTRKSVEVQGQLEIAA